MPYDPRPVSQGGNRGAGDTFQLRAPKGKFRAVGVDTFDGGDWVKDFSTKEAAFKYQKDTAGQMTIVYVYDDKGKQISSAGTF